MDALVWARVELCVVCGTCGFPPYTPTPTTPPPFHNVKKHKGKWSPELVKECQESVLSMLVVGVHQPPMRVGALRVLLNSSSTKRGDPCAFEACK